MPVSDDRHNQKTCLQIYNPAGFSIEFAMVRSSSQRFDCELSIVVWCGVLPHHQTLKTRRESDGFFFFSVELRLVSQTCVPREDERGDQITFLPVPESTWCLQVGVDACRREEQGGRRFPEGRRGSLYRPRRPHPAGAD